MIFFGFDTKLKGCMATMTIDISLLTQGSLQLTGNSANQFTFQVSTVAISIIQSPNNYNIVFGFISWNQNILIGKPNFSDQFKKIAKRYIRVGYNLDIMRQSACLVLNPITVYSYGFLFNCTTVGQASDSMTALT